MASVLLANLPYLLRAALQTLWMSVAGIVLGTALGGVLGILATIAPSPVRWLIAFYVFVVRGIPVLVLMFLVYFAMPALGLRLSASVAAVAALVVYSAAFATEIVRGAVLSVPRGQVDAARSLGMRRRKVLAEIVVPQAMTLSLPPMLNNWIITVKITSYASIIGAWELAYAAREVVERTLAAFEIFFGVMMIYFVICYPLSLLSRRLEARFAFSH
jgi:polar amino acid transport system permease protein